MGRNAKPTDLLLLDGKTHLTKEQIMQRKSQEITLKNQNITPDSMVLKDKRALKEFKNLKKLYEEIDFIGTLDSYIISQYCLAVSELDDLVALMAATRKDLQSEDDKVKEKAIGNFLAFDTEIRLKRAEIIKLSDRLYLNPVARTKNLPQKEAPPPPAPNSDLYGDDTG